MLWWTLVTWSLRHTLSFTPSRIRISRRLSWWPRSSSLWPGGETTPAETRSHDPSDHCLDSILKIHCTHSDPDYLMPWQKSAQSTSTSSGFVVEYKDTVYILTNAHSVEYNSIVQIQRRGDSEKYQATLEIFANECDLAILNVTDKRFWKGLRPLSFGSLPALQDEVQVLGYPTGGDSLSITQGVVSRIEMQEYSQSSYHLLSIQIDAAINAGNSGGPVVSDDWDVIGVAFQGLNDAENIGYVIPVTVVQHVLEDIRRNRVYTGFCSLGISYGLLENSALRNYLGIKERTGIVVRSIAPQSLAKGILKPNDVLLSIDTISIGIDGKVPFRRGERVDVACYVQTKIFGDTVSLEILRQGQVLVLDVPVSIPKRFVPSHWSNQPPPYLIVSGLVFTVLSRPYLEACDAWDNFVSNNVSYLLCLADKAMEQEGDQVVVLVQVLAHRQNLGYDRLTDLHLEKVNGERVRSLRHLNALIQESSDEFLRFEFAGNRIIVLERSHVESSTKEVCEEHSIRRASFLPLDHSVELPNSHRIVEIRDEA